MYMSLLPLRGHREREWSPLQSQHTVNQSTNAAMEQCSNRPFSATYIMHVAGKHYLQSINESSLGSC